MELDKKKIMSTNKARYNPYNINLKEKLLLFSFPHTGSRRSVDICSKLGFSTFEYKNNNLVYSKSEAVHNHTYSLFDGHEKYKLIMTVRNPYQIFLSGYRQMCGNSKIPSMSLIREDFEDFLFYWFLNSFHYTKSTDDEWKPILNKGVTHRIRLESMFESYQSIPFVKEHPLFISGELEKMCRVKVGNWESNDKLKNWNLPSNFDFYYTQKTADLVYDNTRNIFELFDYPRDCWKN